MLDDTDNLDCDARGLRPPPYLMAIIGSPAALRARAEVREACARQDRPHSREQERNLAAATWLRMRADGAAS